MEQFALVTTFKLMGRVHSASTYFPFSQFDGEGEKMVTPFMYQRLFYGETAGLYACFSLIIG